MSVESTIIAMARAARDASLEMARRPSKTKDAALLAIAERLEADAGFIRQENQKDLARAADMGLSAAMIDRLTVTADGIESMAAGLREVSRLDDPVGSLGESWQRPNGLQVARMRIPISICKNLW